MITEDQKWVISQKDEDGLKRQISILKVSNHKNRLELIEYIEARLDSLNVGAALVENGDISDMGGFE